MKYRCKECDNMIEEIDIHSHVLDWHPDEILSEVWEKAMYIIDDFVDYETSKESPE